MALVHRLRLRVHVPVVVYGAEGRDDERWLQQIEVGIGHAVATAVMIGFQHGDVHSGHAVVTRSLKPLDRTDFGVSRHPHRE